MTDESRAPSATTRARTVDLAAARRFGDAALADRLHPAYRDAIGRLPSGRQAFHGLPFDLGPAGSDRWAVVDRPISIDLRGAGPASHVVVAHFCDTWRGPTGSRPESLPVGHVVPVGQPLARYEVVGADGSRSSRVVRRRFEINDGLLGWGSLAFTSVPHLENTVIDWRGPHPAQPAGRYAAAGAAGALGVLPGAWGPAQTGVSDFVPSPTGDILLWLHAIAVGTDVAGSGRPTLELAELVLEPLAGEETGSAVVVAGITLFNGTAHPLAGRRRVQAIVDGTAVAIETDLGTVIRDLAVAESPARRGWDRRVVGWGAPRDRAGSGARRLVDLAVAGDATIAIGTWTIPARDLLTGAACREPDGPATIRVLPPPTVRVAVTVCDGASQEPISARVRFVDADGRYLPPVAHRDEVNAGLYEDVGADLLLGSTVYAYVPGRFEIELPVGTIEAEAAAGFERAPRRLTFEVDGSTEALSIPLERGVGPEGRGWVSADPHVHFLAPSTALLQAAAEDLDLVHLLATQWGDLFTNVTDLPWGETADPDGRRVVVGTENRQTVLGHLGLLGARTPVLPMAGAGPPEGRIAGALTALLADWADRCHAAGGLVVAAHFPLPYAEIAADIVTGRIDAIEAQALAPGLDDPTIVEWYRYLNAGDRLPILGGTDKMSAEVPVGAVRTYARLEDDGALTFDRWADAVRSGRTFVTSAPILDLSVDGHEPGDVIRLPAAGARLATLARARATQPVITALELVVNGRVVAASVADEPTTDLVLDDAIEIRSGSWIAARSLSRDEIPSAFTTAMAAHSSPVYVEVRDRPLRPSPEDAAVIAAVIEGARTWVAELATVPEPGERARMIAFFDQSLRLVERRLRGTT